MFYYLPIRINKEKLLNSSKKSHFLDRFMSHVYKSNYPVCYDRSFQLVSKGGVLVDESIVDFRFNKVKIKISDLTLLTIVFLMSGSNRAEANKRASRSLIENYDILHDRVIEVISSGLLGKLSEQPDRLSICLTALYIKNQYYFNQVRNVRSKLTKDSISMLYTVSNEFRWNIASIYNKLCKVLSHIAPVVLCQGDYVLVDVTDSGLDTLKRVTHNLCEYVTFDTEILH